MPRLRVELRTMLSLAAALGFLLGGAQSYGWPGDLRLSVTQFPFARLLWWVVGVLVGRTIHLPNARRPRLTGLFVLTCVAMLLVGGARLRSFAVWSSDHDRLACPDNAIVAFDTWLRSRDEVPEFWKRNCTHSPATIALGVALTILAGTGGLLMSLSVGAAPGRRKAP